MAGGAAPRHGHAQAGLQDPPDPPDDAVAEVEEVSPRDLGANHRRVAHVEFEAQRPRVTHDYAEGHTLAHLRDCLRVRLGEALEEL